MAAGFHTKKKESVIRFIFDSIGSPISAKKNSGYNGLVRQENRFKDNRKVYFGLAKLFYSL